MNEAVSKYIVKSRTYIIAVTFVVVQDFYVIEYIFCCLLCLTWKL